MKLLELFSGTHSVGNVAEELGWDVVSLDLQEADINCDVMTWDYTQYPANSFDIIWASPPCETFSHLRRSWIGRKLKAFGDKTVTREMLNEDMILRGVPILRKTEEIINYFQPKYYFIENPKNGKMKEFIENRPYVDVDYCQYGFDYRKSTRIWTNITFNGKRCVCKKTHKSALGRQDSINRKTKYRIPPDLIKDIFSAILLTQ